MQCHQRSIVFGAGFAEKIDRALTGAGTNLEEGKRVADRAAEGRRDPEEEIDVMSVGRR